MKDHTERMYDENAALIHKNRNTTKFNNKHSLVLSATDWKIHLINTNQSRRLDLEKVLVQTTTYTHEKNNEYNIPLYLAFDSKEFWAVEK